MSKEFITNQDKLLTKVVNNCYPLKIETPINLIADPELPGIISREDYEKAGVEEWKNV
jgi:hypothetical protein